MYDPAADHHGNRFDAPDLLFRTGQIVAVDHNQIGQLTALDPREFSAKCL
jgi:hypothetical protein